MSTSKSSSEGNDGVNRVVKLSDEEITARFLRRFVAHYKHTSDRLSYRL